LNLDDETPSKNFEDRTGLPPRPPTIKERVQGALDKFRRSLPRSH
jgi:hypothetical protein